MQLDFFDHLDENNTVQTRILNWVSGAALLMAVTWFSYTIFSTKAVELPPRVVNSIKLEPTILLAGKPFTARINVTLNRICPYEVHWSLVKTGGAEEGLEVVKIVEPILKPSADAVIGTQDLPVSTRYVPNSVAPGTYRYVSEVYDMCADGHTYVSIRRNVDLTIR